MYSLQHVGIHALTDGSKGSGNLAEWSSTPGSGPLVLSTEHPLTIDVVAQILLIYQVFSEASRPSVSNEFASDVAESWTY